MGIDNETVAPDGKPMDEQPRYRADYPIDTATEDVNSRRQFLKFLVGASGCFTCGQFALMAASARKVGDETGLIPGEPQRITNRDDISIGEAVLFQFPGKHDPCLLVRLDDDEFVAYSQKCTHLQCPVVPQPKDDRLFCPCHNGAFDLKSGRPIMGPPKKSLPKVAIEMRGNELWAIGMLPGEITA